MPGASSHFYAEAIWVQDLESRTDPLAWALSLFGGSVDHDQRLRCDLGGRQCTAGDFAQAVLLGFGVGVLRSWRNAPAVVSTSTPELSLARAVGQ